MDWGKTDMTGSHNLHFMIQVDDTLFEVGRCSGNKQMYLVENKNGHCRWSRPVRDSEDEQRK